MNATPPETPEDDNRLFSCVIEDEQQCGRIDKVLALVFPDYSRARIQKLIGDGQVQVNGSVCMTASMKLVQGDRVAMAVPPPVSCDPEPENIPLDVVYEDTHLLVINKPAGLVVHPGAGNHNGTLVNALLYHCGDDLSGIGGVLRPGIVHRLDKDTSGLMVVAKSDAAHKGLAAQLEDRSLSRHYTALVLNVPVPRKGLVDAPVGRDAGNRLKMAVVRKGGRSARTHYKVVETFGEALALLECQLESGRTHQIRVHMAHIKHPIVGDPLYGPQATALGAACRKSGFSEEIEANIKAFSRQFLHAGTIKFVHPVKNVPVGLSVPLPEDAHKILKLLQK